MQQAIDVVKPSADERTAIHEAGHAAVALHFGHKLESVSIVPGEGFLGITRGATGDLEPYLDEFPCENEPSPFDDPEGNAAYWRRWDAIKARRPGRLREEILVNLAGQISELVFFEVATELGAEKDHEDAFVLAEMLAGTAAGEFLEDLEKECQGLVTGRLHAHVKQLGAELLTHKSLSGDQAMVVFARASTPANAQGGEVIDP
jgi:hypothetical protein